MDKYELGARVRPALLVLTPLGLAILAWVPDAKTALAPVLGLVSWAAVLYLVAQIARDAGTKAQNSLVAKWGVMPTTAYLRHQDKAFDTVSKARYHARLSQLVPDIKMPTAEEEAADPTKADEVYRACTGYLREQTRDAKKFPLVFAENIDYGYRRNLFGLRHFGIPAALVGAVLCGWKLWSDYNKTQSANPLIVICFLGTLALLYIWFFCVNEGFVRRGAEAYARRIIESIDRL